MAARDPPESSKMWFCMILVEFHEFCWKWWNFWHFCEINRFLWIFQFWGVQAAQTLILSKEYKGFVKGRGIQKIMNFHENSWFSWNFFIFMNFHDFQWISQNLQEIHRIALACENTSNSYAFSMVAAVICAPGHPKTWIFLKFLKINEIFINFMNFHEISNILPKFGFCELPGVPGCPTLAFS